MGAPFWLGEPEPSRPPDPHLKQLAIWSIEPNRQLQCQGNPHVAPRLSRARSLGTLPEFIKEKKGVFDEF